MNKAFEGVRQDAMREVGMLWHQTMLPQHFEESAFQRYRYALRTKSYEKRKQRLFGHKRPLVWTGVLREQVTKNAMLEATKSQVKIIMGGPKWLAGYIAFKGKKGTGPDKKKELTRVLKHEVETMARLVKQRMADAMNRAKAA